MALAHMTEIERLRVALPCNFECPESPKLKYWLQPLIGRPPENRQPISLPYKHCVGKALPLKSRSLAFLIRCVHLNRSHPVTVSIAGWRSKLLDILHPFSPTRRDAVIQTLSRRQSNISQFTYRDSCLY